MRLLSHKSMRLIHWFFVYPLAAIGALVLLGGLLLLMEKSATLPAELICTPGYPCHENFGN